MANSIRKRITDAIMALLDGGDTSNAPTIDSGRINKNRHIPIGRDELPMYSVYFIQEAPTAVGNPRKPVVLDRKLTVETRLIIPGNDDAADEHCVWVISRLGGANPLMDGDTQLTIGFSEAETVFEPLEGSDGKILIISIRWVVEYKTLPADMTKVS